VECGCVRTTPVDRTEGRAKHALFDGHGTVCHVPLTQVAVSPCMHAVSPAVVSNNEHYRRKQRHRTRTTRTVARVCRLKGLKLAGKSQRLYTVEEKGGIIKGYKTRRSQ
jgi:hypothetical protein